MLPSLFFVTPDSGKFAKTCQCPKGKNSSQHLDADLLEPVPSDSSWESMQFGPFQEDGVFCVSFCTGPKCIAMGRGPVPINNCFFAILFVGPMNASPVGHQSQVIQRPVPWLASAKAIVPDMCMSSFQGDTGNLQQA